MACEIISDVVEVKIKRSWHAAVAPRQQVERAGHIGVDKGRLRIASDIRLMECPGVDNRFDFMLGKGVIDHRSLRHRADDMSVSSGRDVEADRNMTSCTQSGGEEAAEPSR
jgi:hypothetical protein